MAKRTAAQPALTATHSVCVIVGEDPFLVAKECEKRLDALLTEEQRMTGLSEPKAADAQIAEVLDELRTVPFLAPRRVVLIKDAKVFLENYAKQLESYLDAPSPCGVLMMTTATFDGRTRFAKKLRQMDGVVEIVPIKANELPTYVTRYAQTEYGITLDSRCSRLLVELTGDDPGRLCREMDKLALFVSPKKTVTVKDIEQLVGNNRMFGAFDVINSIMTSNAAQALARLTNMFESDRDTQYTVVGAFAYQFRKLFTGRALMAKGMNAQQAAEKAGAFWNQKEAFVAQLQRLSLGQLAEILGELGQIDYAIKNGRTTAPVAMERLVVGLFEKQQKTRPRNG